MGKTTVIREMARVLSDELHKRVVIVDTSNEIGGDGDVPHPAIGGARRMQVPDPSQQHRVMVQLPCTSWVVFGSTSTQDTLHRLQASSCTCVAGLLLKPSALWSRFCTCSAAQHSFLAHVDNSCPGMDGPILVKAMGLVSTAAL